MALFCGTNCTSAMMSECLVNALLFVPSVLLLLALGLLGIWFHVRHNPPPKHMQFWGHNPRWILSTAVIITQVLAITEGVMADLSFPGANLHLYIPLSVSLLVSIASLVAVSLSEKWRAVIILPLLGLYWLLLAFNKSAKLTILLGNEFTFEHSRCVLCIAELLLAVMLLMLELVPCIVRKLKKDLCQHMQLPASDSLMYEHQNSNFLSKLCWNWLNKLLKKGFRNALQKEDLGTIPSSECAENNFGHFQRVFEEEKMRAKKNGKKPSLWRVYWRTFWPSMVTAGIFKVIAEQLVFVSPICSVGMVDYVTTVIMEEPILNATIHPRLTHGQFVSNGYVLALLAFMATLVQAALWQNHFYLCVRQGIRCKAALQAMVYQKSLRLSSWSMGNGEMSVGQVVNHAAVDPLHIFMFFYFGHFLWSLPIQVVVGMMLLYYQLGVSALIGAIFLIMTTPLQLYLAKLLADLEEGILSKSDLRLKKVNELLLSVKLLKLYAWEDLFKRAVEEVRNSEVKYLVRVAFFRVISTVVVDGSPLIAILLTFVLYPQLETEPLSAGRAFSGLALFNLLSIPVSALPMIIGIAAHAKVSTSRLMRFFMADELHDYTQDVLDSQAQLTKNGAVPEVVIKNGNASPVNKPEAEFVSEVEETAFTDDAVMSIENGSYSWDGVEGRCALADINLTVEQGKLTMVVGPVGSGKSSLVSALLGEMTQVKGKVIRQKGVDIAYGAQKAWLMNATLRDNILFGNKFNLDRYNHVLDACALLPDLEILTAGDMTEIGEKGINLSGGQKQRISIARTLYSTAHLVILDDPLSALDVHVGGHILEKGILKFLIGVERRTVLLVTHQIQHLHSAHTVVAMAKGQILAHGSPAHMEANHGDLYTEWQDTVGHDKFGGTCKQEVSVESLSPSHHPNESHDSKVQPISDQGDVDEEAGEEAELGRLIEEEDREVGAVKASVYLAYVRSASYTIAIITLLAYSMRQGLRMATDFWLAAWSEAAQSGSTQDLLVSNSTNVSYSLVTGPETRDDSYYVTWFAALCSLAVLGGCIATSMTEYSCLTAAKHFHSSMLNNVVLAPVRFFDITPIGRILNRFSSDTTIIDQKLPVILDSMIYCILYVFGGVIVNTVSTPLFLIPVIPMFLMYLGIQRFYIASSRELQRLDNVTKSPILAHVSETLGGLSTIRAYRKAESFEEVNQKNVDENSIAFLFLHTANVWMGIRLDLLGAFVVFTAAMSSISSGIYGFASPGIVGLSIAYAIMISGILNWMMRYISEAEMYFNCVERVSHFTQLPTEDYHKDNEKKPNQDWPNEGCITFEKVSLRYDVSLDPVINNLSLSVAGGEKVGICGRTGSGKSSLTLGLFRIIDICKGRILVDGLDIAEIPLRLLRSKLSIIPQDPILFEGSIRLNLDPEGHKTDEDLWKALDVVCLKDTINALPGQLEGGVTVGGDNFSVGQRQLFCIARALLRNSRILVMDEATASIDMATDAMVQQVIQKAFKHCTVLTIAHRVSTILSCDTIVVLQEGAIIEQGDPASLLQQPDGVFAAMVNDNK